MIHNEDELPKRQPYTEDRDEDEDEEPYEGEEGGGSLEQQARGACARTRSRISGVHAVMACPGSTQRPSPCSLLLPVMPQGSRGAHRPCLLKQLRSSAGAGRPGAHPGVPDRGLSIHCMPTSSSFCIEHHV
jgi:hypothetical protein